MTRRRARGFTLVEVIIFIVVVLAGMVGVLSVMNTSVAASADPVMRKQALAIAESLLEEILLKEYAKPAGSTVQGVGGSNSGYPAGSRVPYDCVDDYNHYKTTTGVVDGQGNAVAALSAYNVVQADKVSDGVVVTPVGVSDGSTTVTLKRVTVYVTSPAGTVSLTGYRGNY